MQLITVRQETLSIHQPHALLSIQLFRYFVTVQSRQQDADCMYMIHTSLEYTVQKCYQRVHLHYGSCRVFKITIVLSITFA